MATYSPASLGIKPPSGGFQTGGWYNARQYWNGTLGEVNVIHPESNQSGAGQAVNPTVVAASNVAQGLAPGTNEKYIAQQITQTPQTKEQLAPYLNGLQDTLFNNANAPSTKVPTMEELKAELAPTTAKPALLNRTQAFEDLRTSYGVSDLEKQLTDLKAQNEQLAGTLTTRQGAELGKPVALNVIQGRMTEEQRQYQEQADFVGRQISRVTDELNTKYNVINAYMNFMNLDYQDAVDAYDKEFAQNVQMYDMIQGARKEARSEYEYDQNAAKANLQVYMNAISSGNMNYNSLSTDQKLAISKLEVQAGLPIGTIGNIQMNPKDKILAFSDDKSQAIMVDANGNFKTVSTGFSPGTSGVLDKQAVALQTDVKSGMTLEQVMAKYTGTISPNQILQIYNLNSGYGPAKQSQQELAQKYGVTFSTTENQANIGQDLKDAKIAIENGADDQAVKRRFLEAHPNSGSVFDSYITGY